MFFSFKKRIDFVTYLHPWHQDQIWFPSFQVFCVSFYICFNFWMIISNADWVCKDCLNEKIRQQKLLPSIVGSIYLQKRITHLFPLNDCVSCRARLFSHIFNEVHIPSNFSILYHIEYFSIFSCSVLQPAEASQNWSTVLYMSKWRSAVDNWKTVCRL